MENITNKLRECIELRTDLKRRLEDTEKEIAYFESKLQKEQQDHIIRNIDVLLQISEHKYHDCNSKGNNSVHYCPKCILIVAKANGYFPENCKLSITIK